ncbi:DUF4270 domain-containing protein [Xanthomarina sp. F2636L]|uniref:DUF4270 domain-containing protein n=1 Tax=Xanthomarina sp. F2636L TaxID=2996018 RepID=UPI00225DD29A|nr:DUF4270 domain-containing protein [Xanthomarina sp. F2636L]MCX7551127.1 DUF4270 domain-containing protein [Xanthomarina sp. F2636L]
MKKIIKASKFIGVLSLITLTFIACDNDYNSLESDIEGIQNFETNSDKFAVVAYNKRVKPVQTNNFPTNFMGIYYDPVYERTANNIITQAVPNSAYYDPDFGINPEFTAAYLTVPYFSKLTGGTSEAPEYTLDSLYGTAPIKLSIYRSNYFLRDYDPSVEDADPQLYYSNNSEFGIASNLGELLYYNPDFIPSNSQQIIYEENDDDEQEEVSKIPPSLHVPLLNTNDFWKTLLFDKQGMPELSNANNFKDYFRGLYFKVEPADGTVEGSAIMLNFLSSGANLTVYYNNEVDGEIVKNNKFIMNFRGNRASTITLDPIANSLLNNANDTADTVNGDQTLYLKGGEGSIAIVDLFKDPAVLEEFNLLYKNNNGTPSRLINEANLIFYVDQTATSVMDKDKNQEPNRVILYDIKNNSPIVDYYFDLTTNTTNPIESKLNYSSVLEKDSNGKGVKYKIRLTEHLNNILLKDSTNFQLGLYLTTNINEVSNSFILNDGDLDGIPVGTGLSQKGTVLHGSNLNVPENKRVQLEIYYTQPDN